MRLDVESMNLKELYMKYKSIILYVFFGGCTTLVNFATYVICTRLFSFDTVTSTVIAWVLAVTFAYVTNRSMVFESQANGLKKYIVEIVSFFCCRLLTGILDFIIMYVCVDLMHLNDLIMKILSNILVIILNYVASKLLIFKNK